MRKLREQIKDWIRDHWTKYRIYERSDNWNRKLVMEVRGRLRAQITVTRLDQMLEMSEGSSKRNWHEFEEVKLEMS